MLIHRGADELPVAALLFVGLWVLFSIYSLAFGFGSSFDDEWNLSGLSGITDVRSALEFVLGGSAGPLGRPLALLSFVPRAASWPLAPQDFLYENALLHLLNVLLVFCLSYRLARHVPWAVASPAWMALFTALWWGGSPLLFSTSAMIVQRMTSLSAMFCLAGCALYVAGWQRIGNRPRTGLAMMTVGVGLGTLLATLCKENGAILPGLILILDRLLLARSPAARNPPEPWAEHAHALLRGVLLWLPSIALLGYLALKLPEFWAGYDSRTFSMTERLLTEARILLDYLRLLLLPVRSELGPFHDDYPLSVGILQPVSTVVTIAVLVVSAIIAWRWRSGSRRLFSLAVAWFLWGHLMESTVVPLELYFEHRNYLASVGVAIMLGALLFHPAVRMRLRIVLAVLMVGSSLFVLRETALLWGDRPVAAASWHERHPESLRALQFNLIVLHERHRFDEYLAVLAGTSSPLRDSAEYAMIRLAAACNFRSSGDVEEAANGAIDRLGSTGYNPTVTDLLDVLADRLQERRCDGLTRKHIDAMVAAVIENPDPRVRTDMRAQAHEIRARLTIADRDLDATMHHLEEAFRLRPTLSTGIAMAGVLTSAGLYDAAEQKLDELAEHETRRPVLRQRWRSTVAEMRQIVQKERALAESARGSAS